MKKSLVLSLLFSGMAFLSIGLGCFRANGEMKEAKADGFSIEMNGDTISFGAYPQSIADESLNQAIEQDGVVVGNYGGITKYQYKDSYYSVVENCRPYTGAAIMDNGDYGSYIFNTKRYFTWKPITWKKYNTYRDLTYFYANQVLDTFDWQIEVDGQYITGTTTPANDWEQSSMRLFFCSYFKQAAFSLQEQEAIAPSNSSSNTSNKEIIDYVGIMSRSELAKNTSLLNASGTNYALAKSLQYSFDGKMNTAYYYLNSNDNNPSNNAVVDIATGDDLTQSQSVLVTAADTKCGVRPYIAIYSNYLVTKKSGGYSGGGSVNVTLIIAIIFSILGMAGLITFLMLWHKGVMIHFGNTTGPIWMIVFVSISLVICIVGVCMLFAATAGSTGGKGYSESSVVGYYSTPEFTLDVADPDFGCSFYYGLDSQHNVYRYRADKWGEGGINHYYLEPYDGVGTWELQGKHLIITAASNWRLFSWEEPVTSYFALKKAYGFGLYGELFNEGNNETASYVVKGYRWYHGSMVEPTGKTVNIDQLKFAK